MFLRKLKLLARELVAVAFLPGLTGSAFSAQPPRPNIIVILADDMGFSDIGCYGGEIPTPNLDKLAAEGLRFTQFYNTARCCPTRASLLTGLYPHQTGIGHMTDNLGQPGYIGHLNDQCVTMAQVLGPAGYFTAMVGKWHIGQQAGVVPWNRGFDRSLNSPSGGFYYPDDKNAALFLNGKKVGNHGPELPKGWYSTDLWTDFSIKFIDEAIEAKKPFFLYLAENAPHFPLEAPVNEIDKFRNQYKAGWDKLREERYARQIAMKIVDPAWPRSLRPSEVKAWDNVPPARQERFDRIMAEYAAVVAHMDTAIGRLIEALRQRGVLNNTLILFMSDNGANAESGPAGKLLQPDKANPHLSAWEGQSWATLSNTPFRRYKHFDHEGGISTPLIVHWPDGIAAKGELRSEPGHVSDIMATVAEVGVAKYPAQFNGKAITPLEGRSLVPAFVGNPIDRDAIFWEHEGNAAVRVGDWKLVRFGRNGAWELYNLKTDRTEQRDLSAKEPNRTKALADKWEAWALRAHVKPYPDEAGKGGEGQPE